MKSRIVINGKEVRNPLARILLSALLLLLLLLAAILLLPLIGIGIGIGVGVGLLGLGILSIRYRIARRRFAERLRDLPDEDSRHLLPPSDDHR